MYKYLIDINDYHNNYVSFEATYRSNNHTLGVFSDRISFFLDHNYYYLARNVIDGFC